MNNRQAGIGRVSTNERVIDVTSFLASIPLSIALSLAIGLQLASQKLMGHFLQCHPATLFTLHSGGAHGDRQTHVHTEPDQKHILRVRNKGRLMTDGDLRGWTGVK